MNKLSLLIKSSLTFLIILNSPIGFAEEAEISEKDKMVIAVIGNGINESNNKCKKNQSKIITVGQFMFDGANLALKCSNVDEIKEIRKYIKLVPYNDKQKIEKAKILANKIVQNPNLIAVIGHTSSGTTKATVRTYANSGIPVLTPASSPWVMYPDHDEEIADTIPDEEKMDNIFRIIPGDELAQAPAIAFFSRKLEMEKILIIRQDSEAARTYSKPLCGKIGKILKNLNVEVTIDGISNSTENQLRLEEKNNQLKNQSNLEKIEKFLKVFKETDKAENSPIPETKNKRNENKYLQTTSQKPLSTTLKSFEPNGIIYCGYGETAKDLMKELGRIYKTSSSLTKPPIIFSEGISNVPMTKKEFGDFKEIYMAYPFSEIDEQEIQSVEPTEKKKTGIDFLQKYKPNNAEILGYDSMLILSQGIVECIKKEKIISRVCIMDKLKTADFVGAIKTYYFVNGENKLPRYNVKIFDFKKNKFVLERMIEAGALTLTLKRGD